jgi:hypothetical protein
LPARPFLSVGVIEDKRPFADIKDTYIRYSSGPQTAQFNAKIEDARGPYCDAFDYLVQGQA